MDPFFGPTVNYTRQRLTMGQRSLITQLPQDPIPDIFGDRDVFLLENLRRQRLLATTTEGNGGGRVVTTLEPDAAENMIGASGVASPWFTMEESTEGNNNQFIQKFSLRLREFITLKSRWYFIVKTPHN